MFILISIVDPEVCCETLKSLKRGKLIQMLGPWECWVFFQLECQCLGEFLSLWFRLCIDCALTSRVPEGKCSSPEAIDGEGRGNCASLPRAVFILF